MKNNILKNNKMYGIIIVILIIYILGITLYKGELCVGDEKSFNITQLGRNLYIHAPLTDSFYFYSYKSYQVDEKNKTITIQFYRKPFFMVGLNQSDVINIWLNEEGVYKLYYKNSSNQNIFLENIIYNKSYDNKCTIIKNI